MRARAVTDSKFRSLTTTLTEHQTFATLSSNNPRAKGNIRCRACCSCDMGHKKGEKMVNNAAVEKKARDVKRLRLDNTHIGQYYSYDCCFAKDALYTYPSAPPSQMHFPSK